MANRILREGPPPRRPCVYCGEVRKLSKEHVVANWVGKILPRPGRKHNFTRGSTDRLMEGGETELKPHVIRRNGDVGSTGIKRVCEVCNQGWLKTIQDAARPILTPLMLGETPTLTPPEVEIVNQWATMTTINVAVLHDEERGMSRDDVAFFTAERRPPSRWKIFLGKRPIRGVEPQNYHRTMTGVREGDPAGAPQRQSHVTTIEVGHLLIHSVAIDEAIVRIDAAGYASELQVLPVFPVSGDGVDWRSAPGLSGPEVHRLANWLADDFLRRAEGATRRLEWGP